MERTIVTKMTYVPPVVDHNALPLVTKSVVVPDQSLSIDEILNRFVKNIPVDVYQPEAYWNEDSGYDLEKVARMDFSEKAALADELRAQNEAAKAELEERDELARRAKEKPAEGGEKAPETVLVDNLDNTSTVDTSKTVK